MLFQPGHWVAWCLSAACRPTALASWGALLVSPSIFSCLHSSRGIMGGVHCFRWVHAASVGSWCVLPVWGVDTCHPSAWLPEGLPWSCTAACAFGSKRTMTKAQVRRWPRGDSQQRSWCAVHRKVLLCLSSSFRQHLDKDERCAPLCLGQPVQQASSVICCHSCWGQQHQVPSGRTLECNGSMLCGRFGRAWLEAGNTQLPALPLRLDKVSDVWARYTVTVPFCR